MGAMDLLKSIGTALVLIAVMCLIFADHINWNQRKEPVIPARWWILGAGLVMSLPYASFVSKSENSEGIQGIQVAQIALQMGAQAASLCINTAVLLSLGFDHQSDTLKLFLRWLNIETLILTGCVLLGVFGGICMATDSKFGGVALISFAACTFSCNGVPLLALIIYGWVHQPRVTCLMTVLSISIQLKTMTASCSVMKKSAGVGAVPLVYQPPIWMIKTLLTNFDKFVLAALLGDACLHCAYTAGICSAPLANAGVPVACTDSTGVSASINSLITQSAPCSCSTYAAGLEALLNSSRSSSNSSVLLLSTTDNSVELLVNGRTVEQSMGMVASCFSNSTGGRTLGTLYADTVPCAPIQEVSFGIIIGVSFAALIIAFCSEFIIGGIEAALSARAVQPAERQQPEPAQVLQKPAITAELKLEEPV
jgi:hypothetical protein